MVITSYRNWFLSSLSLAFVAVVCAYLINNFCPFPSILKNALQLFSFLPTATALGKRGYDIQTWGGESPAEKLNEKIFLILSSTGFFLMIFSYYLK